MADQHLNKLLHQGPNSTAAYDRSSDQDPQLSPAQAFRLLDLPPELWIEISKLAIGVERLHTGPAQQAAITRMCKALRSELLPYFYAPRFHIRFWCSHFFGRLQGARNVFPWLRSIGPQHRSCLRDVVLMRRESEVLNDLVEQFEGKINGKAIVGEGVQILGGQSYEHQVKFV